MEKNICMGLMMIVSVFLWGTNIVQADAEFPQTYEIEDENVIFHTEIEVPLYFDSNQLRQSTADCMEIDGEGAFTYFAKGRKTAESYEDSSTGEFYRKLTDGSSFPISHLVIFRIARRICRIILRLSATMTIEHPMHRKRNLILLPERFAWKILQN